MGIGMATPMSMSPSSSCASEETCSTEDYFNKDIHQGIVNTMKQLQRGAKSISVTFSTIDKYVHTMNKTYIRSWCAKRIKEFLFQLLHSI